MSFFIISIAGAVGAVARYAVSGVAQRGVGSGFPVGTAAVNLIGALAIGFVAGLADPDGIAFEVGIGLLGGFTTFSTWMVESVGLGVVPRLRPSAMLNVAGMVLAGVCLAALGYTLTR